MTRHDFPRALHDRLAKRVGYRCSNPSCQKLTCGPAVDPMRALSIGVAAHITAASPGGPRFDASLSPAQRSGIENAIWLCQSCGTLVDRDEAAFTIQVLRKWKQIGEASASRAILAEAKYRPIEKHEVLQELEEHEVLAIRALEAEFACHVETNIHVPFGEGWLNLHGALVRADGTLIAIDIRRSHNGGLAYFQIEYLLDLCAKQKFPRFSACFVCIAIVSDSSPEADDVMRLKTEALIVKAGLEGQVRMYRLNTLRAKYG